MLSGLTIKVNIDNYILEALKEDITNEDITTNAIITKKQTGRAELICKAEGIIAGLDVFNRVFELLDSRIEFQCFFQDGDKVKKGDLLGILQGDMAAILTGERTALNYLQHMSGIASYTKILADELVGSKTKLLDTRKTTPNMRIFEKYAVKVGGGYNHRYNLSDGVLIKDNHISAAGSIAKAVSLARSYGSFVRKIEVETENLEMVKEALAAGADIIMLDNMDDETMKKAVEIIADKAITECSGNVTKARLKKISEIGVDYVSCGALTHSAPILDISLKNLREV
ncbi:MAG: carboxylating nicotinate-nucleotide diphosphorylase [Bacillota bacterium]